MKKYIYMVLGLVLLIGLLFPTAALAADVPLHNPGSDYEENSEWHFLINQLNSEADAPATILITWSDGSSGTIALDSFTGKVAHYIEPADYKPAGVYPTGGTAVINQEGWRGQFNLSHGPTPPVPELPVVGLMGLGLAGVGVFFFIKRKTLLPHLG